MSSSEVNNIVNELGYNFIEQNQTDVDHEAPWVKNIPKKNQKIAGCPDAIELVFANMIHIPIQTLPSQLIAQLKRLATFFQPSFFLKHKQCVFQQQEFQDTYAVPALKDNISVYHEDA